MRHHISNCYVSLSEANWRSSNQLSKCHMYLTALGNLYQPQNISTERPLGFRQMILKLVALRSIQGAFKKYKCPGIIFEIFYLIGAGPQASYFSPNCPQMIIVYSPSWEPLVWLRTTTSFHREGNWSQAN